MLKHISETDYNERMNFYLNSEKLQDIIAKKVIGRTKNEILYSRITMQILHKEITKKDLVLDFDEYRLYKLV